jgi:hypothetical protein
MISHVNNKSINLQLECVSSNCFYMILIPTRRSTARTMSWALSAYSYHHYCNYILACLVNRLALVVLLLTASLRVAARDVPVPIDQMQARISRRKAFHTFDLIGKDASMSSILSTMKPNLSFSNRLSSASFSAAFLAFSIFLASPLAYSKTIMVPAMVNTVDSLIKLMPLVIASSTGNGLTPASPEPQHVICSKNEHETNSPTKEYPDAKTLNLEVI